MREISIRRIRIVFAGRAVARDAARELGAAFATALGTALASTADAQRTAAALDGASITVKVPMHASTQSMAAAFGTAVGNQMRERGARSRP